MSHPHIHFIIPAGSYHKARKQWHKNKGKYLFNAFNLAKVWRARLLEYLSRYLYRGVLPDNNIISDIDGQISFEYQDSQTHTTQVRTLPAIKFIYLILQHVLPKGLRRVRDYGLLRGNARQLLHRIQLMLAISGALKPTEFTDSSRKKALRRCPCCQQLMHCIGFLRYTAPVRPTS